MFTGAVNAFRDEIGKGLNLMNQEIEPYPKIARSYKDKNMGWIAIGDENYGEGSSREHAAMEPRFLGASAVLVKSFARIHETNLKKQGILALTFANPADYEKILETDRLSIDLKNFKVNEPLKVQIRHEEGGVEVIEANHTFNAPQIEWFWAGSALNHMNRTLKEQHKKE
jgi:aconitate hydratase